MKMFIMMSLLACSMGVFSNVDKKIYCANEERGIEVSIAFEGYDEDGKIFKGTILRNGRQLRNTILRRGAVSNYFYLYDKKHSAWSFSLYFGEENPGQIDSRSQSMHKQIGHLVRINCESKVPNNWY